MKAFGDIDNVVIIRPIVIATVAVIAASLMDGFVAIRVYEGTNFGRNTDPGEINSTIPSRNRMMEPLRRSESRSDDASRKAIAEIQHLKFAKEMKSTPSMYKVKLTQKGYLQFLRYLADIPPLREFTFCMWFKGSNLSQVQPLFSYAVQDKQRLMNFWYEPKDSTIRMAIREDLAFKIPAVMHEGKWYHICLSWDGIQGRWIVFLDGSKIGSGQVYKYKGTYVPGGGEVVIGQEPTNFHKGLDDGIEGEMFGFNLVDESVKDEVFILRSRIEPDKASEPVSTPHVPPFKALPPIKKSYHEIKAYVNSLPSDPGHLGNGRGKGSKIGPGYPVRKLTRKAKPPKIVPRPARTKLRPRYKPSIRKAVVYERADRRLRLDEGALAQKIGEPAPIQASTEANDVKQTYNENYSVHSYRLPKETQKEAQQYAIYEILDEDEGSVARSHQKKARQNFDLRTARKANSLYAMSNSKSPGNKTKFHFETKSGKVRFRSGVRRSLALPEKPPTAKSSENGESTLDFIPVHEITEDDAPSLRRKRAADATTSGGKVGEDLTADFRRLPHIPDGFINLFAKPVAADIQQRVHRFFPNGTVANTSPSTSLPTTTPVPDAASLPLRNDILDGFPPPTPNQIRRTMVVKLADLERRPGITAGSELVKRSFEECGTNRGSPLGDRNRLVISWANTPVRIYGGAVVTAAKNICGHF